MSADESPEDGRIPLADAPRRHIRDTRLEPAIDAELAWGNPVVTEFSREPRFGDGTMTFAHPLHVARLLDTFRFPSDAGAVEIGGQTALRDDGGYTGVAGGLRPGWRVVPGDRLNRTEPIPDYQPPLTAPRRPPVVTEPSWWGRAGVPGAPLGWPPGPLVPADVWLDEAGSPVIETVGDTGFVVASTATVPDASGPERRATHVEDLDALLSLVPDGLGVLFDGGTPARRVVRPGQLAVLRLHEAPMPGDPAVHLSPVPDVLLDEVRRLGRALEADLHAWVIWASTPESAGLWVMCARKGEDDRVWATIREAQPWPAARYVARAEHTAWWTSEPRLQLFTPLADLPDEQLRPGPAGRSRPPPGCIPVVSVLFVVILVLLAIALVQDFG